MRLKALAQDRLSPLHGARLAAHLALSPDLRPKGGRLLPGSQTWTLADLGWRAGDLLGPLRADQARGRIPVPITRRKEGLIRPSRLIVLDSGLVLLADLGRPAPGAGSAPPRIPPRILAWDPRSRDLRVLAENLYVLDLCAHPDGERLLALTAPAEGSHATSLTVLDLTSSRAGHILARLPLHRPENGRARLAMRLTTANGRLYVLSHATSRLLTYDLEDFRLMDEFAHFFLRLTYDLTPDPAPDPVTGGQELVIPVSDLDTVFRVNPTAKTMQAVQHPDLISPACLEPLPGGHWLCLHTAYVDALPTRLSVLDADFRPLSTRPLDAVWPLHARVLPTPDGPRMLLIDPSGGIRMYELPGE